MPSWLVAETVSFCYIGIVQWSYTHIQHMRSATSLAQRPREAGAGGGEGIGIPLPRHWGGPPGIPLTKVSSPLAVTATEAALEDYRRSQRLERVSGNLCSLIEFSFLVPSALDGYGYERSASG